MVVHILPVLYVLLLEPFLCKLKTNPVHSGISLRGATTSHKYCSYADKVSVLVSSRAETDEVSKKKSVPETLIKVQNQTRYVALWLGSWKGVYLSGYFP